MNLSNYIKQNGVSTDYLVFENNIYIDKKISINDLFLSQYINYDFVGYDIVIMLLAIENYYHLNNYGFLMYEKIFKGSLEFLINKLNNNYKLDNELKIETDINFFVHKDALLLALSLFQKKRDINIRIYNINKKRFSYNIDYLKKYFTNNELKLIISKYHQIKNELNIPYYAIIWPPAKDLFYNIESEINGIEKGIMVLDSKTIILNQNEFINFLYKVYENDDIEKYKVDIKYQKLLESCKEEQIDANKMIIRIIKFLIDYPDYKMKVFNGNPRSKATMRLKKTLRDNYKDYISNYYYDIIIHTTDNSYQNENMKKILKKIIK